MISYKDVVEFAVPGEPATLLEITVVPLRNEWEARVRLRHDRPPWEPLGRRFRSNAKGEALGKMVRWVRGKFPEARPILRGHRDSL